MKNLRVGKSISAAWLSSPLSPSYLSVHGISSLPSSLCTMRRAISDVTGNTISVKNRAAVALLDESIMNCITMQDDASGEYLM